ncbi:MAG: CidA/LrgA family protein [Phycisphaerae bacterium]
MIGLAILLLFNLLGVLLNEYAHIPLPGNVIGLLLLLVALFTKIVKLHWVEEAAHFLLRHMLLFFAPVIVASLALADLLAKNLFPLLAVILVSTLLTALATAFTANLFSREEHS